MKTMEALKAKNIKELKLLGSYLDVKNNIEKELGVKLGVRSWSSLFYKITNLKKIFNSKNKLLLSVCNENSFLESKNIISNYTGLKLSSKSIVDLRCEVENLVSIFDNDDFDPYEYYEKTKIDKFKNSSKLEGIEINVSDEFSSIENILRKYKREA